MSNPSYEGPAGSRPRPNLDAGRLWTGGVAIGSLVSSIARSAVRVVNA